MHYGTAHNLIRKVVSAIIQEHGENMSHPRLARAMTGAGIRFLLFAWVMACTAPCFATAEETDDPVLVKQRELYQQAQHVGSWTARSTNP